MAAAVTLVTVTIEDRADGGIDVFSEQLPGLILGGLKRESVSEMIAPAIKALFEHRGYTVSSVVPYRPFEEIRTEKSPRSVQIHVEHGHQQSFAVAFMDEAA
jgi:hypothetical protein